MKDAMISVRMPSALVKELKELAQKNNYLDLSEQIRDILRMKCIQHAQSTKYSSENKSQSQNIVSAKSHRTEKTQEQIDKEKLVQNLQSIIEQLKRGM